MSITSIAGFIGQEAENLDDDNCHSWIKHDGRYLLDLNHDGYTDIYDGYLHGGCSDYKSAHILFRENVGTPLALNEERWYHFDGTSYWARWETTSSVPEIRWHKSEKDIGAKLGDMIQFGGTNVWLESVTWDDPQDPSSQLFTLRENFCGHASEPILVYVDAMPPMNGTAVNLILAVEDRFNAEHSHMLYRETDREPPITDIEYLSYEIEKFNTKHQSDLNDLHGFAQQMKDCKKIDRPALLSTWSRIAPDLKNIAGIRIPSQMMILSSINLKAQPCKDAIWTWLEETYGVDQNFIDYIKEAIREIDI